MEDAAQQQQKRNISFHKLRHLNLGEINSLPAPVTKRPLYTPLQNDTLSLHRPPHNPLHRSHTPLTDPLSCAGAAGCGRCAMFEINFIHTKIFSRAYNFIKQIFSSPSSVHPPKPPPPPFPLPPTPTPHFYTHCYFPCSSICLLFFFCFCFFFSAS